MTHKYLMRKEMVNSGLLAFDDRPENYWAWKSSFLAATRELNLSDQEELNLLVISSSQADMVSACKQSQSRCVYDMGALGGNV